MTKKVLIKTYGCQMNVYDSSRMRDVLAPLGYDETTSVDEADFVILNTCHIREKAADKVYSELGKLRDMKEARATDGREMLIAVAGCVGQAEGGEIIKRNKGVDLVFGPQTYHRLPELMKQRAEQGRAVVETEFQVERKFEGLASAPQAIGSVASFLTIQEGCDKFCTFCVVPYTRGAEFSRPVAQILEEARKLAAKGVREVTLLGQNVNAYRGEGGNGPESLAGLVTRLSQISGIERIRYVTSHPRDMSDDLIAAHASNEKLMPYLHLPIQSGNDRVLKAMNRGHSVSHYMNIIDRIRKARPDIALSGDFIVGFPGETEEEFDDTLKVVADVGYASAYSFKYSPRPGTPAAEKTNQVPEKAKNERLARLQSLILQQTATFNASCVGKTFPVLLEKPGRQQDQLIGRSPYLQSVHLPSDGLKIGDIAPISIKAVGPNSLSGQYSPIT
ncbi:tRNA (N6-isopentenyl adenosine(37)-C2)-methylthiotransferase MiaB [Aestuariivirga litoralis]|uniref:tRNA (N6-isopentenyl adenosine(37)-C2)-methylthiotransferase MiaB n=1 Tax=Aestuariivirga litoralis TaxID=2650924 RepID=UPI0032B12FF3